MRSKENITIPASSPLYDGVQRASTYSKAHINLNQPRFLSKATTSRYGTSSSSANNNNNPASTAGNASSSLTQNRLNSSTGYSNGASHAVTPSGGRTVAGITNNENHNEQCMIRVANQGINGGAGSKNGGKISGGASGTQAISTHRSASREAVASYTRKSTLQKQGHTSAQAHKTPNNTGTVATNRAAHKVKASQLSASSLHAHTMKLA